MILVSCKGVQNSNSETNDTAIVNETNCFTQGDCAIKYYNNSTLNILEDTIGQKYPVIEKGDNIVIEFIYSVKGPEGTMDGDYSETIHFEISNRNDEFSLSGEELKDIKLLFGKHCFCKGEAGYYQVNKGAIMLEKNEGYLSFNLSFIIEETSQRISNINYTLKI